MSPFAARAVSHHSFGLPMTGARMVTGARDGQSSLSKEQ